MKPLVFAASPFVTATLLLAVAACSSDDEGGSSSSSGSSGSSSTGSSSGSSGGLPAPYEPPAEGASSSSGSGGSCKTTNDVCTANEECCVRCECEGDEFPFSVKACGSSARPDERPKQCAGCNEVCGSKPVKAQTACTSGC